MTARRTAGSLVLIYVKRASGPQPAAAECRELPRVHALADGELPAGEAARVRRHLARCARCQSELAFLVRLAMALACGAPAGRSIVGPS